MSPRRGVLALLLLCSLAVAACGSNNAATSARATTPALSKESYIQQANAICARMTEAGAAMDEPADEAAAVQYLDRAIEIHDDALDELRALPAPVGDETTLRAVYAKVDTMLFTAIAMSDALRNGNEERFEELDAKLSETTDAANAASLAYGLTVCAE